MPAPLTGVAVKVTLVPAHTVVFDALTDTTGTTELLTVIVIELLVAVGAVTQPALDVRMQVIISLCANVVVV